MVDKENGHAWYKSAVFYHIYVRSFQDGNGDGIGDLAGILSRVDYIKELGANAVWLSPFYPSPQADWGYDVADYCNVDPDYGDLADLGNLRDALHQRDMRLILDLVPNHTSCEHPWFHAACASKDAKMRDFYIWRDPNPDGSPPNNWCGIFGGSAWTWHEATGQFYLHSFLPGQPDLNWRNPAVVNAMHDVMRFWLNWGADGFRVDAVHQIIKDAKARSNPPDPSYKVAPGSAAYDPFQAQEHRYDTMQPEVFDVVRGMRDVLDSYEDRVLIGETAVYDWEQYAAFLGDGTELFHLAFNFQALYAQSLQSVRNALVGPYPVLQSGAWPTLVLSNHDHERHVSRLQRPNSPKDGDDALAKLTAGILLTCRGTPFVYCGEEIGMPSVPVPPNALLDPVGLHEAKTGNRLFFLEGAVGLGRDPARTPMQWSGNPHGGFSTATPWLPLGDWQTRNVQEQQQHQDSVWCFYRDLIAIRHAHPALGTGVYLEVPAADDVWAFERRHGVDRVLVLLNTGVAQTAGLRRVGVSPVLFGSHRATGSKIEIAELQLDPFEVLLLEVN